MRKTFIAVVDGEEIAFAISYEEGASSHADMMIAVLSSTPTFYDITNLVEENDPFYGRPTAYKWIDGTLVPPAE
jgi:hypothetical protein